MIVEPKALYVCPYCKEEFCDPSTGFILAKKHIKERHSNRGLVVPPLWSHAGTPVDVGRAVSMNFTAFSSQSK